MNMRYDPRPCPGQDNRSVSAVLAHVTRYKQERKRMSTAIPTINFGRLEDLITEIKDNIRTGKRLLQGVRLSTHYATHSGTMVEKITVVRLILTTLTTDAQGAWASHGLWPGCLAWHGGRQSRTR